MSLIVYRPHELVSLDTPILDFSRNLISLDGHRLVAVACVGPFRVWSALHALLSSAGRLTRPDLMRLIQHGVERDLLFTCLFQCAEPTTGKAMALQLHRPADGFIEISAANPVGRDVKYCGKPGVPFTTLTPPMLAEAPMCALTFAASRAGTLPDMSKHNRLYLSTGDGLTQEFPLTEILERFDNSARMARAAI